MSRQPLSTCGKLAASTYLTRSDLTQSDLTQSDLTRSDLTRSPKCSF
ncbi:pentapeptide repeat-containing protein [Paenibacillus sp. NPDC058071]